MELEQAKQQAINKFNILKDKEIVCPAIWVKIKFNHKRFSHIIYKDSKHKRSEQEQIERFKCFIKVDTIIKKSHLYQEFMIKEEIVKERNHWKTKQEKRLIEYIWLVWIVNHNQMKSRIKVVIRKDTTKEYAEFFSIIPAWNIEWYRNFIGPIS